MRTKTLRLVLESGDVGGLDALVLTTELVLYPDGTITGGALLAGGGGEVALAVTGTHGDAIAPESERARG